MQDTREWLIGALDLFAEIREGSQEEMRATLQPTVVTNKWERWNKKEKMKCSRQSLVFQKPSNDKI